MFQGEESKKSIQSLTEELTAGPWTLERKVLSLNNVKGNLSLCDRSGTNISEAHVDYWIWM